MKKSVLITGVSGQDGSILAKKLLDEGLNVLGTTRSISKFNSWRLKDLGISEKVKVIEHNLFDKNQLERIFNEAKIDYFFSFASKSGTKASFEDMLDTYNTNTISVATQLDVLSKLRVCPISFFANSSEIYAGSASSCIDENETVSPLNPYGASKAANKMLIDVYRESFQLPIYTGIFFPHDSKYKNSDFVLQTIASGLVRTLKLNATPIQVGSLETKRDISDARIVIPIIWDLVQSDNPGNYVIGSGFTSSIEECVDFFFRFMGEGGFIKQRQRESKTLYFGKKSNVLYLISNDKDFKASNHSYGHANTSKIINLLAQFPKSNLEKICEEIYTHSEANAF
jgi:GDPmannose 4,6-dehydratase